MPRNSERVRFVSRRDTTFDHYVADLVEQDGFGVGRVYFGITSRERADLIRRRLRRAGSHLNPPVSVKAYWYGCGGCRDGGRECRYHVSFTAFDPGEAKEYMRQRLAGLGGS